MTSSGKRSLALASLTLVSGAGAAVAWHFGFFAVGIIAVAVGVWAIAEGQAVQKHRAPAQPTLRDAPAVPALPDRGSLGGYLDASPLPLLLLGHDLRLMALNRAARGFFLAEDRIVAPPAGLVEMIHATAPGETGRIDLPSGARSRPFALATSDIDGPLGSGRIAALTDVDAELRAAEAATLRDLVQVLGHEIANTLTPIASLGRTAADILEDDAPDLMALRQAVETIARRAEGLQRFGEAYREMSRLPPPDIARFDSADFLVDLERLFRTNWPATVLHCDFAQAPRQVRADRDQLSAALWAILQNAAEAAAPAKPAVTFTCTEQDRETLFHISDNGAGVPADIAGHIFQPFFTHKPDGTGIGLALARQVMRAHGGEIALDAEQPPGARFHLRLPVG